MIRHRTAKTLIVLSLLAAFAAALLPSPAFADTEATVRVGYMDYGGLIDKDSSGVYNGYAVKYLEDLSAYTGWKYEYVYDTWDNLLKMLENGEIDLLCNAQKTPEREDRFLFSTYSAGAESSIVYVRSDDERYYYNDYSSFNGMRVAVLDNSYQTEQFAEYAAKQGFTYAPVVYTSSDDCFAALDAGTVDAVAMGSLAIQQSYKIVCRFGADPFYFITGKQNSQLMDRLDTAQAELVAAFPTYQSSLYDKYYGSSTSSSNVVLTREEADFIQSCGAIDIAYIPNRLPFSYVDDGGNPAGIVCDIMKIIEERSGLTFNYTFMSPGQRTDEFLQENPDAFVTGIMSDNPLFHTDDYILSSTFYSDDIALACVSGTEYDLNSPDGTYTLAIPRSYSALQTYMAANYPQFNIILASSTEECAKMVVRGEADFMAQNVNVMTPLLQNPHYENMTALPTFFMKENSGIVGLDSERNEMLMGIFNKCISTISDTEISQITVNNTLDNGYHLTFGDMVYKFRYALAVICILLAILIASLLLLIHTRRKNILNLEKKNSQLADAVSQAERANRAKSQFLARMSHEIRTPMNAIVGLTTIARYHEKEPEMMDEYLTKIDSSSKVLLNIINDVLDMSAIESEKLKISDSPFDLKGLLSNISTIYYVQCKSKGVDFEMDTSKLNTETVVGDSLRVNQILLNLVSNAYKFTDVGGHIVISAAETAKRDGIVYIRFTVADTGCGMDESMIERLFKPFEQESSDTAQKHGGSGLGLSIAKNLIDMMHGAISVKSQRGVGSTFTVDLPFKPTQTDFIRDTDRLKNLRALIVDDDEQAREYTSIVLDRIGVNYDTADGGEKAVKMLTEEHKMGRGYDICFVDWKMPDVSGIDVTKKIRELFDSDTLVIIVSAYDMSEVQEEAKRAGADMFVTKPLFQSTVFNLLMQLSGGKYVKIPDAKPTYDFAGKKVLLAEDNELNAEIAKELLGLVNMEIDHAENGQEALDMFRNAAPGTYDAVLMDVQMPVMNGHDSARAIRALDREDAKSIPIYAMTANAFTEDVSAALSAGMNGHIAKPIDTEILYSTLHKAIFKDK